MGLIVTPRQLGQRAEFYQQLGQLTAAGVGVVRALELIRHNPPGAHFRQPIGTILDTVRDGGTLVDGLTACGVWVPSFDRALLRAGESSGQLPRCFQLLADYYAERARLTRQVLSHLLYPLFLLHFAVFIFPLPQLVLSGNLGSYLGQTVGALAPFYALVWLGLYVAQSRRGQAWRALVERLIHVIPVLGVARRAVALSRLATALEAMLSAGMSIVEAWAMAAHASDSPAFVRIVTAWKPRLAAGATPGQLVAATPDFPELFAHLYQTGELSGKLDESLRELARYYQEEGTRRFRALAQWVPRCVYGLIVLAITWRIVQFWSGYFHQVHEAIGLAP